VLANYFSDHANGSFRVLCKSPSRIGVVDVSYRPVYAIFKAEKDQILALISVFGFYLDKYHGI
jgi:hypothetical protein